MFDNKEFLLNKLDWPGDGITQYCVIKNKDGRYGVLLDFYNPLCQRQFIVTVGNVFDLCIETADMVTYSDVDELLNHGWYVD